MGKTGKIWLFASKRGKVLAEMIRNEFIRRLASK